ncbi:hypothetical protein [Parapedobacter soli]|uniref:hypothetical protein n=1 Tax=Parapedobacter soli TaxID=416955 RepID=UPI0021C81677|nr:hypothetical protein [Parapedobacter soli]
MDLTEHPIRAQRANQKRFLDTLPESEREEHAFLFRVGNLSYRYYMDLLAEPNEEDYSDWLIGLPPNIANDMKQKGFEECRGMLPLRRHTAERSDRGLDEFMKAHLSDADFQRWKGSKD